MTEADQVPNPEAQKVTELLNEAGKRINGGLPSSFGEDARLDVKVDGVEITILVNQSWNSDDRTYDVITDATDDEGIRTSSGYHWWNSTQNHSSTGHYSVTKVPKGEEGGVSLPHGFVRTDPPLDPSAQESGQIGPAQAESVGTILDLYFKGVKLIEEEKAKARLFTEQNFGGYIIDIVNGNSLRAHGVGYLTARADSSVDEASLLLSLTNEEIRKRLEGMNEPRFSITDEELDEIRGILQGRLESQTTE